MSRVDVKGLAHITGGGIPGNLNRILPPGLDALIDLSSWEPPAVFKWLAQAGNVSEDEMLRTFNMGAGLMAVVSPADARVILGNNAAFKGAWPAGKIVTGSGKVRLER
jgi:phosphoribosylformylglycinamidine cyclo-ligase